METGFEESTSQSQSPGAEALNCGVLGIGAWGPGFKNWQQLQALFADEQRSQQHQPRCQTVAPKPAIIPANERRRAPLLAKMAVEVSCQALDASELRAGDAACVFGSGLGDTEITDYMCRVLSQDPKQLSPTKFHNSVHNAASGYWTISSGCMKSANSIAALYETAGLCLMEAMALCQTHREPVLITVFDTKAHDVYRGLFDCDEHFACALIICPGDMLRSKQCAVLRFSAMTPIASRDEQTLSAIGNPFLQSLARNNPAARMLGLLAMVSECKREQHDVSLSLSVAPALAMTIIIEAGSNH